SQGALSQLADRTLRSKHTRSACQADWGLCKRIVETEKKECEFRSKSTIGPGLRSVMERPAIRESVGAVGKTLTKLTPGATFHVTAQDVCVPGYAKKVRAVPAWLKRQAYSEYGITHGLALKLFVVSLLYLL